MFCAAASVIRCFHSTGQVLDSKERKNEEGLFAATTARWDQVQDLTAHTGDVLALAVGKGMLFSAGEDQPAQVLVWQFDPGAEFHKNSPRGLLVAAY